MSSAALAVEMIGIDKAFPGVAANKGVGFAARWGEVHALLGENGAGKTTLMCILAGLYRPDAGQIRINGELVVLNSPKDAIEHGVGMVYQHYRLVASQTVAENLLLGLPEVPFRLNAGSFIRQADELSQRYRLHIDPRKPVWQLSVGEQQRVEILKTLHRGARLLILDEPTAVLTPQEAEDLMRTLRQIAAEGRTVILISHKLEEVRSVADRVTVLRGGAVVASDLPIGDFSSRDLAQMMVGENAPLLRSAQATPSHPVGVDGVGPERDETLGASPRMTDPNHAADASGYRRAPHLAGPHSARPDHSNGGRAAGGNVERLRMEDVSVLDDRGLTALKGVTLHVAAGEILGIAGVAGNGQRELAQVVSGMRKPSRGRIQLDGRDVTALDPRQMARRGIAHIPEDRLGEGLVGNLPIADNAVLKSYDRPPLAFGPFLDLSRVRRFTELLLQRFGIRGARPDTTTRLLSGGQLQRLLLAREMALDPRLIVAVHPTRGLDVAATQQVQDWLQSARDQNASVLLISEDLDEVIQLSDRIAVLYEGEIVGTLTKLDADRETIGLMMAGSHSQAAEVV